MPAPSSSPLTVVFNKLSVDVRLPTGVTMGDLTRYSSFWYSCCVEAADDELKSSETTIAECANRLCMHRTPLVRLAAESGSPEALVDLGIRLYTGCGVPEDADKATECWARVRAEWTPNIPPATLARAYACLANQEWRSRISAEVLNVDMLYRACAFADIAIGLGFTPHIAHTIACGTEDAGFRRWGDLPFPLPTDSTHDVNPDRIAALTRLWETTDKERRGYIAKKAKRDEKREKKPSAYVCAAEGCGIEATSKKALMRCSGPCRGEDKPSYCGKECQKRDWKRHKKVCKPSAKQDEQQTQTLIDPPSEQNAVAKGGKLPDRVFTDEEMSRSDGKEYVITMPDITDPSKMMRLSSRTLSPVVLRDLRDRYQVNATGESSGLH